MLILDLWGINFHPVVVVGLGNDLLFNFIVGHCGREQTTVGYTVRMLLLKITKSVKQKSPSSFMERFQNNI